MKICFITTGDIKDIATAKRALGLANPLADLGYEVSILLENTIENQKRTSLECDSRINILYFEKTNALNEIKAKSKQILQIKPDILYLCGFVMRNILIRPRGSIVLTEHSELQSAIPDLKGLKWLLTYFLEYYSMFYNDALLYASKYLENVYNKRANIFNLNLKGLYFPYAFNDKLYKPLNPDNLSAYFKNHINSFNFVFLGTITKNYGVFTILEAFEIFIKNNKNAKLFLLGKGRHYNEAKKFVSDRILDENVFMPGYVEEEDIEKYFSIANVFLSPMNDTVQDWARCPSKLYLYLPYNKPIITSKIGETYETLKEQGCYYKTNDTLDLIKVMEELLSQDKVYSYETNKHNWETRSKSLNEWIIQNFK